VAAISSFGNFGGFLAQNIMPWVAKHGGSPGAAMFVPAACLTLLAIGAICFRTRQTALPAKI
jgi:nitrate/nitrite transporter NarK